MSQQNGRSAYFRRLHLGTGTSSPLKINLEHSTMDWSTHSREELDRARCYQVVDLHEFGVFSRKFFVGGLLLR